MIQLKCPDAFRWQTLLADGDTAVSADLESHLAACPRCQRALDDLAVGSSGWLKDANRLVTQDVDDSEVTQTLHRLREYLADDNSVPPIPLDFLTSSELPGVLGTLGRYQVLEVIGRGAFGIVLKALDPDLLRPVAIKVLVPYLAPSGTARQRFLREARAAAAVSHDHIVTIHAVETGEGLPYIVMEYVTGISLQGRLDRDGPLPPADIARIGVQAANGLAAAHAQGLVHRDIKPANILLENGVERVKITDFGLARAADDARLTQSGVAAGTPLYMSPEQARGEAVDSRSDLFSLGSVLYTLATGFPPFRAESTMGVLNRITSHSPRPIRETIPDFPTALEKIIMQLHEKEPGRRFQLAADVSFRLGAFLANPQSMPAQDEDDAGPPEQHKTWVTVLCLLAGIAVVAIVLTFKTPKGTLVVEVDDPTIKVGLDGEELKITGAGPQEVRLKPGEHHVTATKDGKPANVSQEIVTITKDGRQVVKVTSIADPAKLAAKDPELDRMAEELGRIIQSLVLRGKMKPGEMDPQVAKLSALSLEASKADTPPDRAAQLLREAHTLAVEIVRKEGYTGDSRFSDITKAAEARLDSKPPTEMDPTWGPKLDLLMERFLSLKARLADTAMGTLFLTPGPIKDLDKAIAAVKPGDRASVKRLLTLRDEFALSIPKAQQFAIRLHELRDLVANSARQNVTHELEAMYPALSKLIKEMEDLAKEYLEARPPVRPKDAGPAAKSGDLETRQKQLIGEYRDLVSQLSKTHVGKVLGTVSPGADLTKTLQDYSSADVSRVKRLLFIRDQFESLMPRAQKELDRWEKAALTFSNLEKHYQAGVVAQGEYDQAKLEVRQAVRALDASEECMRGLIKDLWALAEEITAPARKSPAEPKGPGQ